VIHKAFTEIAQPRPKIRQTDGGDFGRNPDPLGLFPYLKKNQK
jgi:hypothetical protein